MGYKDSYEGRIQATLDALHAAIGPDNTVDEDDLVIAEELLLGYHVRWHEEPYQTLHVEHEFEAPLINPESGRTSRTYVIRGKVDALVVDPRDRRTYLVEHKTTTQDASEGSAYWQRLRMDSQVSTYYDAAPDIAGCIYDVIRRPMLRRLRATPPESRKYTAKGQLYASQRDKDETVDEFRQRVYEAITENPDAYFKRGVVVRSEDEMREHRYDVWQQANLMREMANAGVHPRNPESCVQFNRMCEYFEVCTGSASIDDERLFQIRDPFSELTHKEAT